ncbi:MAG: leucine-rich repeat domain-containing protein, partial [Clostridia bacterium]|nr:leucine-rich repeat domain-containing protein [Clostridia bacterium]
MKRFLSLLLCIIIIASVFLSSAPTAFAASYSGSAGSGISWLLDTYSGVLTFSGTGAMADYSADEQPEWNRYQGYIKSVVVESGVTSIGSYAFYNGGTGYKYQKLASVDCSNSVTVINSYAFRGCGGLTQVVNSGSVTQVKEYAFRSCVSLTAFDFSAAVTIENGAFSYCEALNTVNFSPLLTTLGASAFKGCTGISSFTIPAGVKNLGVGAFAECSGLTSVIVNSNQIAASETSAFYDSGSESGMTAYFSSVTTVPKNLFSNCTNLTDVDLSGVITIGEKAFANTGLLNVFIPTQTASINAKAFEGCVSLQSFTVSSSNSYFSAGSNGILMNKAGTQIVKYPAGKTNTSFTVSSPVSTLANNAFSHANNLTSVTVASGVSTISDYAFAECRNLEDINLGSVVTKIGNYSFANCDMLQNLNMNSVTSVGSFSFFGCDSLHSFTSPAALKTISTYAFSNCKSLTNVVLSEGLTTLGSYAFAHCIALVSAVIPSTVSSISTGAFMNCDSLASATITKGVTSLGEKAFLNCTAMQSITVPSTVTTINAYAIGYQYSNKYEPV